MHTLEEITAYVKEKSALPHHEVVHHFDNLKEKFDDFLSRLQQENVQAQAAFQLVVQASFHGHQLTHEEKIEIETQLKEVLKTADLVALTILPGGTVVLILSSFLKLNPYILPSVFLSKA